MSPRAVFASGLVFTFVIGACELLLTPGEPMQPPCACEPTSDCPATLSGAEGVVFLAPGGAAAPCGTIDRPCAQLSDALDGGGTVALLEGSYGTFSLTGGTIVLCGGYRAGAKGWTRADASTAIVATSDRAVTINSAACAVLDGITLHTPDASSPSESRYGVFATSSQVCLRDVLISVGAGGAGAPGQPGASGADGGLCDEAGTGDPGADGDAGAPGSASLASSGFVPGNGENGQHGGSGQDAPRAAGCFNGCASCMTTVCTPKSCGEHGGCGGGGGAGGTGGGGGGASIGVFAWVTSVRVVRLSIETLGAGAGGQASMGGVGGAGNPSVALGTCDWCIADSGGPDTGFAPFCISTSYSGIIPVDAGEYTPSAGHGGSGGSGGGGAGGWSCGIATDALDASVLDGIVYSVGAAGVGSAGAADGVSLAVCLPEGGHP